MEWDHWTWPYNLLALGHINLKKIAMVEYQLRWKSDEIWNCER